jgi:uncharacterized protein (DUF488 family)
MATIMESPETKTQMGNALFSVGHSNHTADVFVDLLRRARITAIADVRSSPYSRRLPQFNREELLATLRTHEIAYVFLGDQLGGRPQSAALYDPDGLVNYERVRQTDVFRDGLARLLAGAERFSIAMMCSEADPLDCHRGLMIAPALMEHSIQPGHLRRDGRIETTPEMEARLLAVTGVGEGLMDGLFAAQLSEEDQQALLAEAYRKRAHRVGFLLDTDDDQDGE